MPRSSGTSTATTKARNPTTTDGGPRLGAGIRRGRPAPCRGLQPRHRAGVAEAAPGHAHRDAHQKTQETGQKNQKNPEKPGTVYGFPGEFTGALHARRGGVRRKRRARQAACKPGSVPTRAGAWAGDGHSSGTPVAGRLARPTRAATAETRQAPPLLGLAPGGVYPATAVTGGAVRSYRTLSPLPAWPADRRRGRFAFCGTFPGVAPAGRYPAPCSRGARTFLTHALSVTGAAIRPSDVALS